VTVLKQVQARIVQIRIEAISAAEKATVRDLTVLAQVWLQAICRAGALK
jgi:hypothetical protein